MGKDFKVSINSPEPKASPGGKGFYTFFTEGPPPSALEGRRHTIIVDFKGREDLLDRFKAESSAAGDTPAQHMLWLAGVYIQGLDRSGTDAAAKS